MAGAIFAGGSNGEKLSSTRAAGRIGDMSGKGFERSDVFTALVWLTGQPLHQAWPCTSINNPLNLHNYGQMQTDGCRPAID